jgi:hypothetical protein
MYVSDEEECEECLETLEGLEEIDEEADLFGIRFVKVTESSAAVKYGVHGVPKLAYFRKKTPVYYEGISLSCNPFLKFCFSLR